MACCHLCGYKEKFYYKIHTNKWAKSRSKNDIYDKEEANNKPITIYIRCRMCDGPEICGRCWIEKNYEDIYFDNTLCKLCYIKSLKIQLNDKRMKHKYDNIDKKNIELQEENERLKLFNELLIKKNIKYKNKIKNI